MPDNSLTPSRKQDHIRINLEEDVQSGLTNGLNAIRFKHRALPELDLEEIDLSQQLFGKELRAPLLISSMTGGTPDAHRLNLILAEAAQQTGIALGVGSQRAAIENPVLANTFRVRAKAPDILLLANLGAVQLNYGYGLAQCQAAVEMIEADALILHFNSLQEAIQEEGDTNFAGLLAKVEFICSHLPVPVIAKEVGWGFSIEDARRLKDAGVAAIDVAGAGGTSWSQVERYRLKDEHRIRVAEAFRDWGLPTAESIVAVKEAAPSMTVFASGGLRNGVDIAKCLALGASVGGMAGPYLKAAELGLDEVLRTISEITREIQICMFGCGAPGLRSLNRDRLFIK